MRAAAAAAGWCCAACRAFLALSRGSLALPSSPRRSYDEFGRPRRSQAADDRRAREAAALERLQGRYGSSGGQDRGDRDRRDRSRSRERRGRSRSRSRERRY